MRNGLFALGLSLVLASCGGPAVRTHLTALVLASDGAPIEQALVTSGADAEVSVVPLPEGTPVMAPDRGAVGDRIAGARVAYEEGDYESCIAALREPSLLDDALDAGDTSTAARLLWWQAACSRAGSGPDAARAPLETMALLDLARPAADIEVVSASLDVQLADVRAEIAARARVTWTLEVPPDARVRIDGASHVCASTCPVALPMGRHHVRVEADGRVARSSWAELGEGGERSRIELDEASPEASAAEWRARYGGAERETEASLALLRRALRAEHLVLVLEEPSGLRGIYASREGIESRAQRAPEPGSLEADVQSLLFELLPWARPDQWWETPWPWIVLGAVVAAGAAALTYYYAAPTFGPSIVRVGVMP